MVPSKRNDLMKLILTACISIIITGVTSWFAFGHNVVNKDYLEHYDSNYSCWAKDKALITDKLTRISENNIKMLESIQCLQKTVDELRYQQKVMSDELKKQNPK